MLKQGTTGSYTAYVFPNPKTGAGFTDDNFKGLHTYGVFTDGVYAGLGSGAYHYDVSKIGFFPTNGAPKYWADTRALWQFGPFKHIFFARDNSGGYLHKSVNYSDPSFEIYSKDVGNFYQEYNKVGVFTEVPLLLVNNVERNEAIRMSFADGTPSDFPAGWFNGALPSFPQDCAAAFDENGEIIIFKYQDYVKANQLDFSPQIPKPQLPPSMIVAAVKGILASGMSDVDMVKAWEELFG